MKRISASVSASVVSFTLAFGLLAAGCSSDTSNQANPNGQQQSKFMRYNSVKEPTSLDPSVGYDQPSYDVVNNFLEGLTRLDKNQNPAGAVAKDWKVSEDGKTYTFNLREEAKWSNGDPVSADDFIFAWKHMLDPKTASDAAFLAYPIVGAEEYNSDKGPADAIGLKAINAKTLEIKLKQPAPWLIGLLANPAFYPINKANAEKNPKWFTDASTIVSNGPFKLTEWKHDSEIKLVKNDNYWDKNNVKLDGVIYKMIADGNTEYQLFQSGQLESSQLPADMSDQLFKEGKVKVNDSAGIEYYRLNTTKPPFNNLNIRKAFNLAIDRQKLVDLVQKRKEKPAVGLVSYGFKDPAGGEFRDVGGTLMKTDTAEAKKLLEKGMQELGLTTFPEITLSFNSTDVNQKNAEAVQAMLKDALGVNIKLASMDRKVLTENQKKLDYQISRSSWLPDFADPVNTLEIMVSDNSSNRTGWKNAQFDKLIKDSYNEPDNKKRFTMMHEAEKILMDEQPIIPLYFYNSVRLEKDNVIGVLRPTFGYIDFKYADIK